MTFKKRGLKIHKEGNLYRIFPGDDIDRQLRVKDMKDEKALAQEVEKREAKAEEGAEE